MVIYMIDNNLRYCREELEMTQEELGIVLGASKQTISNWETGYTPIPLNKLVRFANLYNYSLDFICGFTRKNIEYGSFKIDKVKIGKKLRELRTELKLSQQQIADDCGFFKSTYGNYEVGRYLINTMNIYSICKTYNISMDWLVGRSNNIKISK